MNWRGVRLAAVFVALIYQGCADEESDLIEQRSCSYDFYYEPEGRPKSVAVIGDFNGWQPWELSPAKPSGFRGSFIIGTGRHAYRFLVDGKEVLDPTNPLTIFGRDGVEHSALVQKDCTRPTWRVQSAEVVDAQMRLVVEFVASASTRLPLDYQTFVAMIDGHQLTESFVTPPVDDSGVFTIKSQELPKGKHRLQISAKDAGGVETSPFTLPFWVEDKAFDWSKALVYQVITDRFRRGGEQLDTSAGITFRNGGNWAGITEAIKDKTFAKLGVNAIWISPAIKNVEGEWPGFDDRVYQAYHGYWPISQREIEPKFGDKRDLHQLISTAHQNGIRVILDVVPNHVHINHPWFSQHRRDWFNHPNIDCVCGRECSWGADIEHCWFTDYLADLNWKNAEVLDAVLTDIAWWIHEFDLDGLRVDAVPMMPRLVTRHLRDLTNRLFPAEAPHFYLVGETFTGSMGRDQIRWYLGPYGLSGQFDFPLMWALRSVIGQGHGSMTSLLDELDEGTKAWAGSGAVMSHMIGNHDVARFITVATGDESNPDAPQPSNPEPYKLTALAQIFVLTQPGIPVLYQGDEIGLAGGGDPDNRRPMPAVLTANQQSVLDQVRVVGRLRTDTDAFTAGKRSDLIRSDDHLVYRMDGVQDFAIVALNRSKTPVKVMVDVNNTDTEGLKDCLGGLVSPHDDGKLEIVIPAMGAQVIAPNCSG